jgi:hypothetical protein
MAVQLAVIDPQTAAEKLLFATVPIQTEDRSHNEGFATGFVFSVESEGRRVEFLVTNKHVVRGADRVTLTFTRGRDNKPIVGDRRSLDTPLFANYWFGHPNEAIDVAIAPLEAFAMLKKPSLAIGTPPDPSVTDYYTSITVAWIPRESEVRFDALEEIVFVGYPSGVWDSRQNLPVFRRGITATPLNVDFGLELPIFLIDASVFPGSSGSPVFLYRPLEGRRLWFLGIVSETMIRHEIGELGVVRANQVVSVTQQMIDLGVVYKAQTIVETVNAYLERRAAGQLPQFGSANI